MEKHEMPQILPKFKEQIDEGEKSIQKLEGVLTSQFAKLKESMKTLETRKEDLEQMHSNDAFVGEFNEKTAGRMKMYSPEQVFMIKVQIEALEEQIKSIHEIMTTFDLSKVDMQ